MQRNLNTKSIQTDSRPTTGCGIQTVQKTGFLLAQSGAPGEALVDDDVVEYADTAAGNLPGVLGLIPAEPEEPEEPEVEVAFGPGGQSIFLPQRKNESNYSRWGLPGAQAPPQQQEFHSDAEVAHLQAEVKQLRKQLDDFHNGTVLREKELHSIVESCRTAFENDFANKLAKADADRAQNLEGLHRTIRSLHEAIANLEETVAKKDEIILSHEKLTTEAVREKCREWKLVEASLQMELGRMRGEREKIRFEAELAEHRGRGNLIEAKTLAARAHDAEQRWFDAQRLSLVRTEHCERDLIANAARESLSGLIELCISVADGVNAVVQHNRGQWIEVIGHATKSLLPTVTDEERAGLVDSAFSHSKTLFHGSKVFAKIVDRIGLAQEAETERQRFYERDTQQKLQGLQSEAHLWNETLDGVRKAAETRLEKLAMRCSSIEKVSQRLVEKSDVFAKKRADHKARSSVLDDLVAEHAAETEEMSQEIKRLRQENESLRITNKITEAEELHRKLQKSEALLKAASQENGQLRMKVGTLESTCENMDNGIRHHFSALEKAQLELATVRARMEDRESAHAKVIDDFRHMERQLQGEISELRKTCSQNDDQMKQQTSKIQFLEKAMEMLKEKYLREVEGAAMQSKRAAESSTAEDSAEVVALRQKVLMMKRENDALSRKLDGALAEASHSEEHRLGTVTRCLAMMAAEDAAPRREQLIIGQQMQLLRDQKALEAREAEILARQALVERKDIASKRAVLPRPAGLRETGPSVASEGMSDRQSSAGSNSSSTAALRPSVKLAPLTQRPPAQSDPFVEHPQRLPQA